MLCSAKISAYLKYWTFLEEDVAVGCPRSPYGRLSGLALFISESTESTWKHDSQQLLSADHIQTRGGRVKLKHDR